VQLERSGVRSTVFHNRPDTSKEDDDAEYNRDVGIAGPSNEAGHRHQSADNDPDDAERALLSHGQPIDGYRETLSSGDIPGL
jgi:hypothetical protein